MSTGVYLAKIINRLGLLSKLNLNIDRKIRDTRFHIPLIQRTGLDHFYGPFDSDYFVYEHFAGKISEGIFLDVGANIGQTALRVFTVNAKQHIISFEPNKFCIDYLHQFRDANPHLKLTIVGCAISDTDGKQKLYLNSEQDTGASLDKEARIGYFDDTNFLEVDTISGETVNKMLDTRASFIKIDVEGAELIVLKGLKSLILRDRPIIYCEVLDAFDEKSIVQNTAMKNSIRAFITDHLSYSIFRFDRPNNVLAPVSEFPVRAFKKENLDACNYILMPSLT